ncbi:hypothetical protein B0H69_003133 [Clostridium beijerinckii]|jgi:hypothetical protein|nr:hypothetical protein [Clostridium beijerinckii]NRU49089.1 hypothetical protein [Clostridium beijerinckii]NRZ28040.1 hypothetical protein [Clostridium beijerinckii]NRZ32910.1 hypothetical protein [Clostridium beijerinckii]NSA12123.1 hypothetical protein [Clostridium beijerinckii]
MKDIDRYKFLRSLQKHICADGVHQHIFGASIYV